MHRVLAIQIIKLLLKKEKLDYSKQKIAQCQIKSGQAIVSSQIRGASYIHSEATRLKGREIFLILNHSLSSIETVTRKSGAFSFVPFFL